MIDLKPDKENKEINKPFLTVKEVAEALQCCPRTVRNQIQKGRVPFKKVGSDYRIPTSFLSKLDHTEQKATGPRKESDQNYRA